MLQACAARSRGTAHMLAALLCVAAAEGRSGVREGGFLDKQAAQHNRDDYCVELVAVMPEPVYLYILSATSRTAHTKPKVVVIVVEGK